MKLLIRVQKKGQAAPLLLMLIAVVLVCVAVVFNLGKVSLNRVDTQNASDAGALAAASWLASGQNVIGDISQVMFANSLAFIAEMARVAAEQKLIVYGGSTASYIILNYNAEFCALQLEQLQLARELGEAACTQADKQGKFYAFFNVGVDEYGSDNFNQWIANGDYTGGVYAWEDTKYQYWDSLNHEWVNYKSDRTNQVSVSVDAPAEFTLTTESLPGFCVYWSNPYVIPYIGDPLYPYYVAFTVDPAFISKMNPANAEVTVETTRTEPDPDLRLWQMKVPDITSGSRAKTSGGGPIFAHGGNYDCHLIEAW